MNKKLLLFAGTLLLLFAVKFALSQTDNNTVGWDPYEGGYDDPAEWIFSMMMASPLLGALIGATRVLTQRFARPVVQPICLR